MFGMDLEGVLYVLSFRLLLKSVMLCGSSNYFTPKPIFSGMGEMRTFFGPRYCYPNFHGDTPQRSKKSLRIQKIECVWVILQKKLQQNTNPIKSYRILKSRPTIIFPRFNFVRPGIK